MIIKTILPRRERLSQIIGLSWDLCAQQIAIGRIRINKESSLQLHLGSIIKEMGQLFCIDPEEFFTIELETSHEHQNIDVFCTLGDIHAAIEIKCFRQSSNRPIDVDMYDVLKDIVRLESYTHASIRRFICLTDNPSYPIGDHNGHAGSVSIREGKIYPKDTPLIPSWRGLWKDKSRDHDLTFRQTISFSWNQIQNWYYLYLDI